MQTKTIKSSLRSDGKPRATAAQISAARKKAAAARWAGNVKAEWRSIRVHADTYDALEALRTARSLSWDALFATLAAKRRR